MKAEEINFDGLIGPTHHFGGHAYGNLASMEGQKRISNPKKAALQGLKKMKMLHDLGVPQGILPPHRRPSMRTLRSLGFSGSEAQIIESVAKKDPRLLYAVYSASSMWAANSATVSPSVDTSDGRLHLTVASLLSHFHRSIEAQETFELFQALFADPKLFKVHPPLPCGDEGAANHTRFCSEYGQEGTHLFVYSQSVFDRSSHTYPFRQTKEAQQAIVRKHGLNQERAFYMRQNSHLIERGVFHNDLIAVGNQNLFLYHEKAFTEPLPPLSIETIRVTENQLTIKQALQSYFFNSQLVSLPDKTPLLIAPKECASLDLNWLNLNIKYVDLSESLQNGGGPACLRLRVVMNTQEKEALGSTLLFSEALYTQLVEWVKLHYREQLTLADLHDPKLLTEVDEALDALTQILNLSSIYEHQKI